MKISRIKKALILGTIASASALAGCELLVDFDRQRIPQDATEASLPDALPNLDGNIVNPGDGSSEASTSNEGGTDAGTDAPADAPTDGG